MLAQDVRSFLHAHGIRLNTDLGQHFLIDESILRKIVDAAALRDTDHVVEIGPGIGILTRELLRVAGRVTAIEIDPRMVFFLHQFIYRNDDTDSTYSTVPAGRHLTVLTCNALQAPMPTDAPYKIVANIPYHITSPLLRHLLLEAQCVPSSLTLLMQREVAEQISDDRSASILTVLVRLFGTARIIARVPPQMFLPPPAVDSAVLHIDCSMAPRVTRAIATAILKLVKHAMSQRRKMLRSSIGKLPGGLAALAEVAIT